jgi:hypothetical protein
MSENTTFLTTVEAPTNKTHARVHAMAARPRLNDGDK